MRERLCEDCGEPIPEARLKARPLARLCVGCQEQAEDDGKFQRPLMDFKPHMKCGEVESVESVFYRGTV